MRGPTLMFFRGVHVTANANNLPINLPIRQFDSLQLQLQARTRAEPSGGEARTRRRSLSQPAAVPRVLLRPQPAASCGRPPRPHPLWRGCSSMPRRGSARRRWPPRAPHCASTALLSAALAVTSPQRSSRGPARPPPPRGCAAASWSSTTRAMACRRAAPPAAPLTSTRAASSARPTRLQSRS